MAQAMEAIARFITQTSYADFSEETIGYTKRIVLSCLGGMIAGAVQPTSKIVSRYIRQKGGAPEAGVVYFGLRVPVAEAGLCNATSAHASELEDDSFPEGCLIYNLVPTALALGEYLRSSGREIIESIIVGYDVQAKSALYSGSWGTGHWGFTLGCWGPAAGAAKLLKLDAQRTKMTMAIAASLLCGLPRQTGSMTHLFEAGIGAFNGLLAALLAKDGFTGTEDIIEISRGLWDVCGYPRDALEKLAKSFGEPYRVMEVGIKKYPCCYFNQRIIDGTLELKDKHGISYAEVDTVQVHVAPWFSLLIHYPDPANAEEARFSVEHAIAAALLGEQGAINTWSTEKACDPRYKAAREKVTMIVHDERGWEPLTPPDQVTIKLKDGREYTQECEKAIGEPPNYLSEEWVFDKLRRCAEYAHFLSKDDIERVGGLALNLEKVEDVSTIMEKVTFGR